MFAAQTSVMQLVLVDIIISTPLRLVASLQSGKLELHKYVFPFAVLFEGVIFGLTASDISSWTKQIEC